MADGSLSPITYCTGYWILPANKKRSPEHYRERIPKTLQMIRGSKLVVFHETPSVLDMFESAAKDSGVTIVGQRIALSDLPAFKFAPALLACCKSMDPERFQTDYPNPGKEKAVGRYLSTYLESGEESYMGLMTIWMSKVYLVTRAMETSGSDGSKFFAWIDASVSRVSRLRSNWNFAKIPFNSNSIHHYDSKIHYLGQRLSISAGFLCAHADIWPKFLTLFEGELLDSLTDRYAHDEETLLHRIMQKHPHLFTKVGYRYSGPRMLLGRLLRKWHGD